MGKPKCFHCRKDLSTDGEGIVCNAGCKKKYHFICSGVSESTYKTMPTGRKDSWLCVNCRSSGSQKEKKPSEQGPIEESKTEDVVEPSQHVDSNSKVGQKESLLAEMNNKLTLMSNEMTEIKETVSFMSEKYDRILEELKDFKKIKANYFVLEKKVEFLENKINDLEQYSRNKNLELKGIEETPNENLKGIVVKLASKMGVENISESSIDVIHRVDNRTNREPKDIIVQFNNRTSRNLFLEKKKERVYSNEVSKGRKDNVIYINEQMTPQTKQIFWETKNMCKEKNYNYVWFREGKIFVRKAQGTKAIRIKSMEDIKKLD